MADDWHARRQRDQEDLRRLPEAEREAICAENTRLQRLAWRVMYDLGIAATPDARQTAIEAILGMIEAPYGLLDFLLPLRVSSRDVCGIPLSVDVDCDVCMCSPLSTAVLSCVFLFTPRAPCG